MSIVGPRPALPREVELYSDYQRQRLYVTPGLSCYWQIAPHRNEMSLRLLCIRTTGAFVTFIPSTAPRFALGDHAGITQLSQPVLMLGSGRNVLCLALGQHCIADLQRDGGVGDINGNGIPFFDQADGAAGGRLRADVTDGSTAGCAGEAAIRDEGYRLIQLHACQRRGGVEHLPHTGPPLGPS